MIPKYHMERGWTPYIVRDMNKISLSFF